MILWKKIRNYVSTHLQLNNYVKHRYTHPSNLFKSVKLCQWFIIWWKKILTFPLIHDDIQTHTAQRLMLSKGAKRTKFYHITVILQYCWDKTIARSRNIYRHDSVILRLVIKCFGITNTPVQNFAIRISSVKTVPKCLRKLNFFSQI